MMDKTELGKTDNYCFACGRDNPVGLKLSFKDSDNICWCEFTPRPEHQGWNGYTHGGIISTLLDEAMAQWLWRRGIRAMTADLHIRFSLAVPTGTAVRVEAEGTAESRHGLYRLQARLILPDGRTAARAEAKFLVTGT